MLWKIWFVVGRWTFTCYFTRSDNHCVYKLYLYLLSSCCLCSTTSLLFFFRHPFCSLWQAAPRLSETCEKRLAPRICEGRLHFPLPTKGLLHRTKSESLSYIAFSSHTILFTRFASLVHSVTESAVGGSLTLCLAWIVLQMHLLHKYGLHKACILCKCIKNLIVQRKEDTMKYPIQNMSFKTWRSKDNDFTLISNHRLRKPGAVIFHVIRSASRPPATYGSTMLQCRLVHLVNWYLSSVTLKNFRKLRKRDNSCNLHLKYNQSKQCHLRSFVKLLWQCTKLLYTAKRRHWCKDSHLFWWFYWSPLWSTADEFRNSNWTLFNHFNYFFKEKIKSLR